MRRYVYSNGRLDVWLFVPDLDSVVVLRAHTSVLWARTKELGGPQSNTCYLDLVDLPSKLPRDEHGLFVPPTNFHEFMSHVRNGLSLAYGYTAKEYSSLLRLNGSRPLLACLLEKPEDATWERETA